MEFHVRSSLVPAALDAVIDTRTEKEGAETRLLSLSCNTARTAAAVTAP